MIAAPIMAIFLLAVFWRKTTNTAAGWTLGLCLPMFILPYLLRFFEVNMNAFNIAGLVFVFSILFMILVSKWTEAPDPSKIASVLWKRSTLNIPENLFSSGYPVYRWISIWWVITISIFIALYIRYW